MVFYLLVAIFGYTSTLDATPEVFVERVAPWGTDFAMTAAQLLVICSLITVIMLNYLPLRSSVLNLFLDNPEITFRRYNSDQFINMNNKNRAVVGSAIFTIVSCVVTLFVTKLSFILAIAGGVGSVTICYILPLIAYYKTVKEKDFEVVVSVALGVIIGGIGLFSALHPLFLHHVI